MSAASLCPACHHGPHGSGKGSRCRVATGLHAECSCSYPEMFPAPDEPAGAPLSRDALLHELARSLRATHPDRCEELIAEIEFRLVGRCTKCRARIVGVEERLCTACDPALEARLYGDFISSGDPAPTANTPRDWTDQ